MASLKTGLVALSIAALCGVAATAGCSAEGTFTADLGTDTDETEPSKEIGRGDSKGDGAQDDQETDPDDNGGSGTGGGSSKDGGSSSTKDAGSTAKDAGAPAPNTGDPCTGTQTFTRSCGNCGTQKAFCFSADGGPDGQVGEYSTCSEPAGACAPGSTVTEACGNCGTITRTCNAQCKFPTGTCVQPANSCVPGTVQRVQANCPTGSYSSATCLDTCQWSGFSQTCTKPTTPNKMTISSTEGQIVTATWTLGETAKRPTGSTCPATSLSTTIAPAVAVEISNPTAQTAELTLFQSKSATGKDNLDLVIWGYAGDSVPLTDDGIKACSIPFADSCLADSGTASKNLCGNTSSNIYFASADKVSVPAGGKIIVFSALYSTTVTPGDNTFNLNVRTNKLN